MDPEKFLNLQMQMRENNMEVADFLNDFTNWKETVELKSKRLENSAKPEIPAIRNSLLKKNKKKPVKQKISDKKVERIKAYDYQAWDKFDVDKALAEDTDDGDNDNDNNNCTMDKTVGSPDHPTRNSSSETDEEQEDQRRLQLSKDARELGNVRFKEGRLDEAIEQYTMAIRLAPEDPTAYTNRAFAYIKTERYASAEADCIAALKLDQKSIKALFRRALARKGLGHITEAIEDLKELLKLNPDNKSALSELNSLTYTTKGNTSVPSTPSSLIQSGNNKQRKMRKISIIEVGGNVGSSSSHSSQKTTHTDSTPQVLLKTCSSSIKEVVNGTESLCHPTVKMTNSSSEALKFPSSTDKSIPSESVKKSFSQPVVNSTGDHNNPLEIPPSSKSINMTKPPSNWFQLEREIRELCRSGSSSMSYSKKLHLTKEAIIYLCNIQPTNYQALFGENMDSDFLSRMLHAFYQCVVEGDGDQSSSASTSSLLLTNHEITDRLLTLTKLSRFDVAWLMTDDVERVHAVKLIKHLQNDHSISKDIIKQICVQFECDD